MDRPLSNRRGAKPLMRAIQKKQPTFARAVLADVRIFSACRGERARYRSRLEAVLQAIRLCWVTDSFLALVCYRLKVRAQVLGVPVIPRLAHRASMSLAQVSIGDPVVVHPGVYLPHGQVVLDGVVELAPGVRLRPWVTIGLLDGDMRGATVGRNVKVGTGAKIIGPVTIGDNAVIGANAVVLDDVPAGATVVGAPARRI